MSLIRGHSDVVFDDDFIDSILAYKDKKVNNDPDSSHFEDTLCPSSPTLQRIVSELKDVFFSAQKMRLKLENWWSHIEYTNMSCNTHNHWPYHVSAVYYVKVPEGSGKFVCYPPGNPYERYNAYYVTPEEKTFILFPSWLDHAVLRNRAKVPRISLSFNFNIQRVENKT